MFRTKPSMTIIALIASIGAVFGLIAHAQTVGDYPKQPIKIVVPYSAGGGADMIARLIGQRLGERLKQSVVVENKGGASNTIGINAVAKSPADGYTLGLVTPVFVMTPSLLKNHPYDTLKDLTPVSMLGFTPLLLVVHPSLPANNVKEFVDYAKDKKGVLNFGSLGPATTQGLAATMFNGMAGIEATQVPYKGSAPATTDLLSGNLQYMFNAMPSMIQQVKAGKLRALGISSTKRSPLMPDVPPIADTVAGYDVTTWYGLVAPAGTPKAILDLLNREIGLIVGSAEAQERLKAEGLEATPMSVDAFGAHLKQESAKWAKVIKDAGVKPE